MQSRISVLVVAGPFLGRHIELRRQAPYVVGRGSDCDLILSGDGDGDISRHHCIIDVMPAGVSVTDLGSRNGTFVNGECIGRRTSETPTDPAAVQVDCVAFELDDGDEIRIGQTCLRVGVETYSAHYANLASAAHADAIPEGV
jgi:eukaryotic-like serine/threonine-protein kinase